MLKIDAQIIKDKESYKLVVRVLTKNDTEVAHTKFLELATDLIESAVMLRNPFQIEFDSIEDVKANLEAIETVKQQASEAAAAIEVVEAEVVTQ